MKEEIWKDIVGYEGLYQISSNGHIRNIHSGYELKEHLKRDGYLYVFLTKDGKSHTLSIHRLVASASIPFTGEGLQVNHKNLDKHDNSVDNLEWVSAKENTRHAIKNKAFYFVADSFKKLTNEDVKWIRKHYVQGDPVFGASSLGAKFHICKSNIYRLVNGKSYREVV